MRARFSRFAFEGANAAPRRASWGNENARPMDRAIPLIYPNARAFGFRERSGCLGAWCLSAVSIPHAAGVSVTRSLLLAGGLSKNARPVDLRRGAVRFASPVPWSGRDRNSVSNCGTVGTGDQDISVPGQKLASSHTPVGNLQQLLPDRADVQGRLGVEPSTADEGGRRVRPAPRPGRRMPTRPIGPSGRAVSLTRYAPTARSREASASSHT